jgi:plastocyanin
MLMRRRVVMISTMLAFAAITPLAIAATTTSTSTPKLKTVKVADDYYNPAKLRITKGTTVKWIWAKTNFNSHNVTLSKGPAGIKASAWTSKTAASGVKFSRTFRTPGTYHFYCTIHPTSMLLTVVVKK